MHKEKITHFPPQSVGSFIVEGISWQKEILGIFSPWIQLEEGSPWFYTGPAFLLESTASKWQRMSYLATCFYVTFFWKTWMPYFMQYDSRPVRTSSEGLTVIFPCFLRFAAIYSWGLPALETLELHFLMLLIW